MRGSALDRMFCPRSVAFFGASEEEGSLGKTIAHNLLTASFQGSVWLINPQHSRVYGHTCYPNAKILPEIPDLAIIATPPETIPQIMDDISSKGIRFAVIITSGVDVNAVLAAAQPHNLRIIGPNCFGLIIPPIGFNGSFSHLYPAPGNIAFVSQSGAIISAFIDWAKDRGVGFSRIVSMGNMCDMDIGDVLEWLSHDPQTDVVALYLEEVSRASKFMAAARSISAIKPVIILKAGRHAEGAQAATSHTGALAGADDVYSAAFQQAGFVRVVDVEDLFYVASMFSQLRDIGGDRLAILTNGGGAGVLAVDRLIDYGGSLAELDTVTVHQLNHVLPTTWSGHNPVDIIGDATPDRYVSAFKLILEDPNVDALLMIHCPTAMASSAGVAKAVVDALPKSGLKKPLLTCWMGGEAIPEVRHLLTRHHIPLFSAPETALRCLSYLTQRVKRQNTLIKIASEESPLAFPSEAQKAHSIILKAIQEERKTLNEVDSKILLECYGIPTVPTSQASTPEEAESIAKKLLKEGAEALVVKVLSDDITHKSDVGGVVLSVRSVSETRKAAQDILHRIQQDQPAAHILGFTVQPMVHRPDAHELILGIAQDKAFGPILLFGAGGTSAEIVKDRAVALPPLTRDTADELMKQTRIYKLLQGYRHRPAADLHAIADVLLKLSQMVKEQPHIQELDINPLLADAKGVIALDARVIVKTSNKNQ